MIAELVENNHKCLIFTNFLATVDRQSLVRRFQTDNDVKAFIMTLKTGGTGLNLTAAEFIISPVKSSPEFGDILTQFSGLSHMGLVSTAIQNSEEFNHEPHEHYRENTTNITNYTNK